jgi:hypothetical protein
MLLLPSEGVYRIDDVRRLFEVRQMAGSPDE